MVWRHHSLTYRICTQQQIDSWDWWLHAFPTYLRFSRPQLFKLPVDILTGANSKEIIRRLDKDLQTILHLSFEAQKLLLKQHKSDDAPLPIMLVGDPISVKPCDHFASQLSPTWTGPFEVISQAKNDPTYQHVNMKHIVVLHSERVKPFFGTYDKAMSLLHS